MTVLYSNDFEAVAHGGTVAAFTTRSGTAWSVLDEGTFPAAQAPRGVKSCCGADNGDSFYWNGNTALGGQAIRTASTLISGAYIGHELRASTSTYTAYVCTFDLSGGNLQATIYEISGGSVTQSAASGYTVAATAGDVVHMESSAIGSAISCRIWTNSNSRPSTATISLTDSTYTTGAVAVRRVAGSTTYAGVDDLVITDGAGGEDFFYAADTTAPVLTSPTGTQTGSTTATIGATTDEGNGTIYGFVSTSATPPSDADLKAGTGAVWAGSASVSSTGAKTLSATVLTASTAYYAHLLHTDAATNDSNIVTSAQFTTAAGGGGASIAAISNYQRMLRSA